jgi:hypothetical protein
VNVAVGLSLLAARVFGLQIMTDPLDVADLATVGPTLIKLLAAIAISTLTYLVLFRPLDRVKVGTFRSF